MRHCIPAVLLVLMLAACGPAAPEATPGATATQTATPTPTPSPTPTPQADPSSTLPLGCSDLLSEGEAQATVGTPVTLKRDDTVVSIYTLANRQVGALECSWAVETSTGDDGWLFFTILAAADTEFAENVAQNASGATTYVDGSTTSLYQCQPVHLEVASCNASVLLNGYWMQTYVKAVGQTDESASAAMRSLVDTLTVRMAGAGAPRSPWVVPAGSLTGAFCDQLFDPGPAPAATLAATVRSGLRSCTTSNGAEIDILPGGAWGVPLVEGTWAFYEVSQYVPFDVPAADLALWGCDYACRVFVSVGGSAVSIYVPTELASTVEQLTPLVTTIVADVAAAG